MPDPKLSQLELELASTVAERDILAARVATLDSALLAEQNACRAAEEEVRQIKIRFDPEVRAAERAKLVERRDQLLAEVEQINKELGE